MKLITLTLNPAFDVHCYVENFERYREHLATVTDREAGGKGVNISRALTANGAENLALVVLGKENAADFCRALDADGMRHLDLTVDGRIRENITIHTNDAPETRISFAGFRADPSLLARVGEQLEPLLEQGTVVTFTGRVPEGLSMTDVKAFLRGLKDKGVRVVIDSRSFSKEDLIDVSPWLIKPNQEEISQYLQREITEFSQVLEGAEALFRAGIEHVMISLGARGALLVCSRGRFIAQPPSVDAISTIGAGDSSIGGFLAATAEGASPEQCLVRAVSYGSAACMTAGTRPPLPRDVARIRQGVTLKKL